MAVPIASVINAPIVDTNKGAKHQKVVTAVGVVNPPSYYTPVPVGPILKTATIGGIYSETMTAQGGVSPYAYVVITGALPSGITLNTAGALTATTVTATTGTYTFTVRVTDANGNTGSQSFSIPVVAASSGSSGTIIYGSMG